MGFVVLVLLELGAWRVARRGTARADGPGPRAEDRHGRDAPLIRLTKNASGSRTSPGTSTWWIGSREQLCLREQLL